MSSPSSRPSPNPLPLALGRFKQLPQRSTEVWQGGLRKLPMWIDDPHDLEAAPYRPVGAFWTSVRTGLIHLALPNEGEPATLRLALDALLEFGLKWAKPLEGRPARVEVDDPQLRDALADALAPLNTAVVLVEDLPRVTAALRDFEAHSSGGRRLPGALEATGVTPARLRAFADAAARFYASRPWDHLANDDLLIVEAPPVPRDMTHLCVLGHGGQQFGLSFFETRRAFERIFGDGPDALRPRERAHGVTFGPIDDLPFGDVDAWEAHGLPVAGPDAYPLAADMRLDGTFLRFEAPALTHLEALLRALADTTEEELDAGRWQRRVETFDGPITMTLRLPLLLEAERGDRDTSRAVRPAIMPRLAERGSVQVARFLAPCSFSTLDEMHAALADARQQGLFEADAAPDQIARRPLTALEEAQELAYDAMEATGRLQIKLARQALAQSADCADAWVVLGDAAATAERAIECYQHGVDAGARAIGDDTFAAVTGEFWSHLGTRPYMRARLALAGTLRDLGRHEEAFAHYRELLRLNPNDNQGVRYLLLAALLDERKDDEAGALLDRYPDDIQAIWAYGRVLQLLRATGDTPRTHTALTDAVRIHPHVVKYLLKPDSLPLDRPPHFALGSKEEAAYAADALLEAFESTAGAVPWLRLHATRGGGGAGRRVGARPRGHRGGKRPRRR